MTKAELVDAILERARINGRNVNKRDVEVMLDVLDHAVTRELMRAGHVPLPGIGMLEVIKRKERKGRNPRTGAEITIPACNVVRLRVAASLKDAVNQK